MEIERLRGLLDGTAREGILDGDFTPLTEDLLSAPILDRLRLPKVSLFDGTGDPSDHLGIYSSWAILTPSSAVCLILPSRAKHAGGGTDFIELVGSEREVCFAVLGEPEAPQEPSIPFSRQVEGWRNPPGLAKEIHQGHSGGRAFV